MEYISLNFIICISMYNFFNKLAFKINFPTHPMNHCTNLWQENKMCSKLTLYPLQTECFAPYFSERDPPWRGTVVSPPPVASEGATTAATVAARSTSTRLGNDSEKIVTVPVGSRPI